MLKHLSNILQKGPTDRLNDLTKLDLKGDHTIDGLIYDYYQSINVPAPLNNFHLRDFLRNQRNYSSKKSFPCLLVDKFVDTIQPGYLGQLDEKYFDIVSNIYSDICKRLPYLKDSATKVFTFMGALPSPLTIPPPSTQVTRIANGLAADSPREFNDTLYHVVSMFLDNFMGLSETYFPKIASNGNPGFPEFCADNDVLVSKSENPYAIRAFHAFKKAQCHNFSIVCNEEEFNKARSNMDMRTLLSRYGVVYMWTDQHRGQNDKSTKERYGYTEDSWNTDSYATVKPRKLDKSWTIENFYSNFHQFNRSYTKDNIKIQSKRSRLVFAMSSSINTPINLVLSNFRKNFSKAYEGVYKCSCVEHALRNLSNYISKHYDNSPRDFELFTFDITQYDNNIAPSMLYAYVKAFYDYNSNLGYDIGMLSTAPGSMKIPFAEPDQRCSRNYILNIGDPINPHSYGFGISPSGTADVSEKAKLIPTAFVIYEYLSKIRRVESCLNDVKKLRRVVDDILSGNNSELFFMNLGDNVCIVSDVRLEFRLSLLESSIFKIDISEIGEFGGLLIRAKERPHGELKSASIDVSDSPVSTLHKLLSPERPIDDNMRSTYELGLISKYDVAEGNRDIAIILDSIDRNLYDALGSSSQYDLAKRNINNIIARNSALDDTYREIALAASRNSMTSPSSFFVELINSGGDKLFYTDLYDSLTDREKQIVDKLFFTNIEEDVFERIYKYYTK